MRAVVLGYYAAWTAYRGPRVADIDATGLTHITYAFAGMRDGRLVYADSALDAGPRGAYAQLRELKARTGGALQIGVAVGGWGGSGGIRRVAASEANRRRFAESVARFVTAHGLDFVDLDWEFPVRGAMGDDGKIGDFFVNVLGTAASEKPQDPPRETAQDKKLVFAQSPSEWDKKKQRIAAHMQSENVRHTRALKKTPARSDNAVWAPPAPAPCLSRAPNHLILAAQNHHNDTLSQFGNFTNTCAQCCDAHECSDAEAQGLLEAQAKHTDVIRVVRHKKHTSGKDLLSSTTVNAFEEFMPGWIDPEEKRQKDELERIRTAMIDAKRSGRKLDKQTLEQLRIILAAEKAAPAGTWSGPADDKRNMVLLLEAMRAALPAAAGIHVAVSGSASALTECYDLRAVAAVADHVLVMTYDFARGDGIADHAANLRARTDGPTNEPRPLAVVTALETLTSAGVPANKLVLGVPLYARAFDHVIGGVHGLGGISLAGLRVLASSLHLADTSSHAPIFAVQHTETTGWADDAPRYADVAQLATHWDEECAASWAYDGTSRRLLSLETQRSLTAKLEHVYAKGRPHVAGVFFWELSGDRPYGDALSLRRTAVEFFAKHT